MRYVSIDVETTGLGNGSELLELAMVLEDTACLYFESGRVPLPPVEDLPHFVSLVGTPGGGSGTRRWEAEAMEMHHRSGLIAELKNAPPYEEAMARAEDWLTGHVKIHPTSRRRIPIVPAGKNFAGFDKRFLPSGIVELLDYRALDPGSVFVDFTKDRLPGLAQFLPSSTGARHRALEDARDVIRVLRRAYSGDTAKLTEGDKLLAHRAVR